ncbi:hypothetical protein CEK25_013493 [Fusarium fujikuroi]|nr:hypothetical protein CEK25_013493 [Fusarium fujikuroi]
MSIPWNVKTAILIPKNLEARSSPYHLSPWWFSDMGKIRPFLILTILRSKNLKPGHRLPIDYRLGCLLRMGSWMIGTFLSKMDGKLVDQESAIFEGSWYTLLTSAHVLLAVDQGVEVNSPKSKLCLPNILSVEATAHSVALSHPLLAVVYPLLELTHQRADCAANVLKGAYSPTQPTVLHAEEIPSMEVLYPWIDTKDAQNLPESRADVLRELPLQLAEIPASGDIFSWIEKTHMLDKSRAGLDKTPFGVPPCLERVFSSHKLDNKLPKHMWITLNCMEMMTRLPIRFVDSTVAMRSYQRLVDPVAGELSEFDERWESFADEALAFVRDENSDQGSNHEPNAIVRCIWYLYRILPGIILSHCHVSASATDISRGSFQMHPPIFPSVV